LNCADLCIATAGLASRCIDSSDVIMLRTLELCAESCRLTADECERRVTLNEQCRASAAQCRSCREACLAAMQDVGGESGLVQTN
jgi:hypothetical protein